MEELEKNGQEARGSNKGGGAFYLDLRLAKEFQALYETCNWIFGKLTLRFWFGLLGFIYVVYNLNLKFFVALT